MVSVTKKLILSLIFAGLFLSPLCSVGAGLVPCGGPGENPCTVCDLLILIQNIIDFVIKGAFIICIVLVIYGGFRWLLSLGKEANIALGQKTIISALFGLLIVLASWLIVHTIFWLLSPKIEGIDNLNSTWFKLECYPGSTGTSEGGNSPRGSGSSTGGGRIQYTK